MQNISAANISKILENISKLPQKSRKIFPNYCKTIWCFPPRGRQREGWRPHEACPKLLDRNSNSLLSEKLWTLSWRSRGLFPLRCLKILLENSWTLFQWSFKSSNFSFKKYVCAAACCNLQKVLNRYKVLTLSWGDTSPIWRYAEYLFKIWRSAAVKFSPNFADHTRSFAPVTRSQDPRSQITRSKIPDPRYQITDHSTSLQD